MTPVEFGKMITNILPLRMVLCGLKQNVRMVLLSSSDWSDVNLYQGLRSRHGVRSRIAAISAGHS